jgi:hypothetical protein
MKHANAIVFVIVAAAVLVAAYAIGLLVRQARVPHTGPDERVAATPNEVAVTGAGSDRYGPGRGRRRDLAQGQPTVTAQEQTEMLERMSNLTEEEQEEFRQQIRQRFSPGGRRSQENELAAKRRAQMYEKWQSMSEAEREAFRAQMAARMRARRQNQLQGPSAEAADANAAPGAEPGANEADPNEGGSS